MRPILDIQHLFKAYNIQGKAENYLSLRDSLAQVFQFGGKGKKETFWALEDINFQVMAGESVGIIGRNGAGKSTLLKILSQITPPTKGSIRARGRVASLLEVGTGFHPELTGRENIYLNGSILGLRKQEIDKKFDEIIDFAGTESFLETPLKHYSSGMQLRLAFAVAAHLEPEILVIDEVLAVGDAAFQQKCLGKMGEVARSGRTILFVSHNMGAVQKLCERTLVLNDGKLLFDGPTAPAIDHYIRESKAFMVKQPLIDRIDRQGSKEFRFTNVDFYVPELQRPVLAITTGIEARIGLHYTCKSNLQGAYIDIAISFYKITGDYVFSCRSDALNKNPQLVDKEGVLTCILPKNPLKKGQYSYNLLARVNGRIVDYVVEAGYVAVNSGDYYGTGKTLAEGQAGVYVDYDWMQ